jgi:hypothetical protein
LEAEVAGDGGAAVLEVVEAGGVEEPVWADGLVGVGQGEPVEMCAEQPVVDLAVHSGSRASWRLLSGATSAHAELVAGQPVGHAEADEAFDGGPHAPAACERRAPAEELAELTQVNQDWFAFAPQHGLAPQDQQRGRADDSGPDLLDVGSSSANPTRRTSGMGPPPARAPLLPT